MQNVGAQYDFSKNLQSIFEQVTQSLETQRKAPGDLNGKQVTLLKTDAKEAETVREALLQALGQDIGDNNEHFSKLTTALMGNCSELMNKPLTERDIQEAIVYVRATPENVRKVLKDTLKVASFPPNAEALLQKTLSECARHPDVIKFLDGRANKTAIEKYEELCKVCALAAEINHGDVDNTSGVAYLSGFSCGHTCEKYNADAHATRIHQPEPEVESPEADVMDLQKMEGGADFFGAYLSKPAVDSFTGLIHSFVENANIRKNAGNTVVLTEVQRNNACNFAMNALKGSDNVKGNFPQDDQGDEKARENFLNTCTDVLKAALEKASAEDVFGVQPKEGKATEVKNEKAPEVKDEIANKPKDVFTKEDVFAYVFKTLKFATNTPDERGILEESVVNFLFKGKSDNNESESKVVEKMFDDFSDKARGAHGDDERNTDLQKSSSWQTAAAAFYLDVTYAHTNTRLGLSDAGRMLLEAGALFVAKKRLGETLELLGLKGKFSERQMANLERLLVCVDDKGALGIDTFNVYTRKNQDLAKKILQKLADSNDVDATVVSVNAFCSRVASEPIADELAAPHDPENVEAGDVQGNQARNVEAEGDAVRNVEVQVEEKASPGQNEAEVRLLKTELEAYKEIFADLDDKDRPEELKKAALDKALQSCDDYLGGKGDTSVDAFDRIAEASRKCHQSLVGLPREDSERAGDFSIVTRSKGEGGLEVQQSGHEKMAERDVMIAGFVAQYTRFDELQRGGLAGKLVWAIRPDGMDNLAEKLFIYAQIAKLGAKGVSDKASELFRQTLAEYKIMAEEVLKFENAHYLDLLSCEHGRNAVQILSQMKDDVKDLHEDSKYRALLNEAKAISWTLEKMIGKIMNGESDAGDFGSISELAAQVSTVINYAKELAQAEMKDLLDMEMKLRELDDAKVHALSESIKKVKDEMEKEHDSVFTNYAEIVRIRNKAKPILDNFDFLKAKTELSGKMFDYGEKYGKEDNSTEELRKAYKSLSDDFGAQGEKITDAGKLNVFKAKLAEFKKQVGPATFRQIAREAVKSELQTLKNEVDRHFYITTSKMVQDLNLYKGLIDYLEKKAKEAGKNGKHKQLEKLDSATSRQCRKKAGELLQDYAQCLKSEVPDEVVNAIVDSFEKGGWKADDDNFWEYGNTFFARLLIKDREAGNKNGAGQKVKGNQVDVVKGKQPAQKTQAPGGAKLDKVAGQT